MHEADLVIGWGGLPGVVGECLCKMLSMLGFLRFMFWAGEPPVQGSAAHKKSLTLLGIASIKAMSDETDRSKVRSSLAVHLMM